MAQAGPSHPPSPDQQRFNDVRHATNFRSVTRNDPSVLEIIDTSVYSVIYHYDESAGAWEKQKQEGPLFVVRRSKAPEYALFMLNRQAVKGVTIPLIPGEMKTTVVDASTLQVARRGEKLRKGIWFSDGSEAVERFKQTISRICGEPTKKPSSTSAQTSGPSDSPASTAPIPERSANDGLSRLFAGLMTTPSNPSSPATSAAATIPTPPIGHPSPAPPLTNLSVAPARAPSRPSHPSSPAPPMLTPEPQPQFQPIASIPPYHTTEDHPPGQTVDDLLMSILGVAQPAPPLPAHTLPAPQHASGLPFLPPQPQQNPLTSNRVRDATFAQAAGAASGIVSPNSLSQTPQPPLPQQQQQQQQQYNGYVASPANGPSAPLDRRSDSHSHLPPNGYAQNVPAIQPIQQQIIGDALISGLEGARANRQLPPTNQLNEVGKRMFVQDILQLIHTDQEFVERVWRGYLMRTGQIGPA